MGGEKSKSASLNIKKPGSPPRGRGKALYPAAPLYVVGITPAWAGKSLFCFTAAVPIQDHPRVGGEKRPAEIDSVASLGSPPHGRGKVAGQGPHRKARGITPAWAGKRDKRQGALLLERDHPRMGGEKFGGVL